MPTGLTVMTTNETDEERLRRLSRDRYERPLRKRFYKLVSISDDNTILLDGRVAKTPMKAVMRLPTRGLAEAVAREWEAQDKFINPGAMPVTRYANAAIDRAVVERKSVLDEIARYAGNDLVCYRADRPPALVQMQSLHWDPVLAFARASMGADFRATIGVVHVAQSPAAIAKARHVAAVLDAYHFTALSNLTTLTGSALLSLMLLEGAISGEAAWLAAHVDEDYQIAEWGEDDEAKARRAGRRLDYDALLQILDLLRKP